LQRCTGDVEAFLTGAWGKRAVPAQAADPMGFADLLTLDDVDRFLTTTALRTPFFRLVRAGSRIPESSYTRSGRTGSKDVAGIADPARVAALFEEGATIVLQGLHRWSEPATRFTRDLELELGHACQINAYITPPGAQGLALHEDPHDVFVLQAFGRKAWEIHAAPDEQDRDPLAVTLSPGDTIYMPAGTPHAAAAQEVVSGHLTVGVHVTSWRDALSGAVADALDRVGADPVPAGWHRDIERLARGISERLVLLGDVLRDVDPVDVARRRADRFWSSRAQLARGSIQERAAPIRLDDSTVVRRREGAVCELRLRGETLVVLLGDRRLEMPAWIEPAMRRMALAGEVAVGDLARELPDASSRVVLARRLIREGLLTTARA
jgi:hypothetical protein